MVPTRQEAEAYFTHRGGTVLDFNGELPMRYFGNVIGRPYPRVWAIVEMPAFLEQPPEMHIWYWDALHGGGFWTIGDW